MPGYVGYGEDEPVNDSTCRGCKDTEKDEVEQPKTNGVFHEIYPKDTMPNAIHETPPHRTPELHHSLQHDSSVLAVAVGNDSIYAGTQDGEIVVWAIGTYTQTNRIQAHKHSVMCLFLSDDGTMLFSSAASDPIVNVWCPRSMTRLYEIYSTHNSFGDIFSVAYSPKHQTVYYGAQNTSIQWVALNDTDQRVPHDCPNHPDRRAHHFFDSRPPGGTSTPRLTDERFDLIPRSRTVLETDKRCNRMYAHFGFVYCMLMTTGATAFADPDEDVLISGGGDGTIKAWRLGGREIGPDGLSNGIEEIMTLGEADAESVMSLCIDGSFLYSGKLGGIIELWDLDTKQKLRQIKAHDGDVWALRMGWGYLWSGSSKGTASKHSTVHYDTYQTEPSANVSQQYQCLTQWNAHDGKILASAVTTRDNNGIFITGANDNTVAVWLLGTQSSTGELIHEEHEDMMITSLREFVSYKTISSVPQYAEDCRRGATFLRVLFKKLGADVQMLSTDNKIHHPVICAKFSGKAQPAEKRKRVLFYGHYDVVPAETKDSKWDHDPFQLKGLNGYLYGRGVSDNKGPIMAALYAVTDLMQAKALDSDIIFLIEGQEESGSIGFRSTVQRYKEEIGHIDYILIANSYWLDDVTPCLTYGLRGVMHATVCVESRNPDLHSGVDGSYLVNEPLSDLVTVLAALKSPKNRVLIPGFYDNIPETTEEEETRFSDVASVLLEQSKATEPAEKIKARLMAKWLEPNLTHHNIEVSGSNGSLISQHASAKISVRLVPGQEVEDVTDSLTSFIQSTFNRLESDNKLHIQIDDKADPWLGDPHNYIFRTLEDAILKAWSSIFADGTEAVSEDNAEGESSSEAQKNSKSSRPEKPLYIREGGSIPAIRFLEKEFNAPAAHFPCGQASDAAHLSNERLRVENLLKSREIFTQVFKKL